MFLAVEARPECGGTLNVLIVRRLCFEFENAPSVCADSVFTARGLLTPSGASCATGSRGRFHHVGFTVNIVLNLFLTVKFKIYICYFLIYYLLNKNVQ